MDDLDLLQRVGLALAIGALIGLERGWHSRRESGGVRTAGFRTFALIGLLGGFLGVLSASYGELLLALAFVAFAALVVVAQIMRSRRTQDYGVTTSVSALLTLILGVVAVRGDMALAAAGGVVATGLLAIKSRAHHLIRQIKRYEIDAAVELLVISVVLLPLLPNKGFGPGAALNPYELWWIVVLIAGLSFVGYIAIRTIGARRGTLVTGILGGLAASTAIAVSFSRMSNRDALLRPALAAGITAAASMMFLRVLLVVGVLNAALLPGLALSMSLMALTGFLAAGALYWRSEARQHQPADDLAAFRNPLELRTALQFGAILVVVVILAEVLRDAFGDHGLYLLAAISGLTDVDAISVSVARMAHDQTALIAAVNAIVIAVFVNTAVKAVIVVVVGGKAMARFVLPGFLAMIAVGALSLWLSAVIDLTAV